MIQRGNMSNHENKPRQSLPEVRSTASNRFWNFDANVGFVARTTHENADKEIREIRKSSTKSHASNLQSTANINSKLKASTIHSGSYASNLPSTSNINSKMNASTFHSGKESGAISGTNNLDIGQRSYKQKQSDMQKQSDQHRSTIVGATEASVSTPRAGFMSASQTRKEGQSTSKSQGYSNHESIIPQQTQLHLPSIPQQNFRSPLSKQQNTTPRTTNKTTRRSLSNNVSQVGTDSRLRNIAPSPSRLPASDRNNFEKNQTQQDITTKPATELFNYGLEDTEAEIRRVESRLQELKLVRDIQRLEGEIQNMTKNVTSSASSSLDGVPAKPAITTEIHHQVEYDDSFRANNAIHETIDVDENDSTDIERKSLGPQQQQTVNKLQKRFSLEPKEARKSLDNRRTSIDPLKSPTVLSNRKSIARLNMASKTVSPTKTMSASPSSPAWKKGMLSNSHKVIGKPPEVKSTTKTTLSSKAPNFPSAQQQRPSLIVKSTKKSEASKSNIKQGIAQNEDPIWTKRINNREINNHAFKSDPIFRSPSGVPAPHLVESMSVTSSLSSPPPVKMILIYTESEDQQTHHGINSILTETTFSFASIPNTPRDPADGIIVAIHDQSSMEANELEIMQAGEERTPHYHDSAGKKYVDVDVPIRAAAMELNSVAKRLDLEPQSSEELSRIRDGPKYSSSTKMLAVPTIQSSDNKKTIFAEGLESATQATDLYSLASCATPRSTSSFSRKTDESTSRAAFEFKQKSLQAKMSIGVANPHFSKRPRHFKLATSVRKQDVANLETDQLNTGCVSVSIDAASLTSPKNSVLKSDLADTMVISKNCNSSDILSWPIVESSSLTAPGTSEFDSVSTKDMSVDTRSSNNTIPKRNTFHERRSIKLNALSHLREKRDAKLSHFQTSIANARNKDMGLSEAHQITDDSKNAKEYESQSVGHSSDIGKIVESLSAMKQEKITKTASLLQNDGIKNDLLLVASHRINAVQSSNDVSVEFPGQSENNLLTAKASSTEDGINDVADDVLANMLKPSDQPRSFRDANDITKEEPSDRLIKEKIEQIASHQRKVESENFHFREHEDPLLPATQLIEHFQTIRQNEDEISRLDREEEIRDELIKEKKLQIAAAQKKFESQDFQFRENAPLLPANHLIQHFQSTLVNKSESGQQKKVAEQKIGSKLILDRITLIWGPGKVDTKIVKASKVELEDSALASTSLLQEPESAHPSDVSGFGTDKKSRHETNSPFLLEESSSRLDMVEAKHNVVTGDVFVADVDHDKRHHASLTETISNNGETFCNSCGFPSSLVEGGMKFCQYCESAVYCSVECREWDLQRGKHAEFCTGCTGNIGRNLCETTCDRESDNDASMASIDNDSLSNNGEIAHLSARIPDDINNTSRGNYTGDIAQKSEDHTKLLIDFEREIVCKSCSIEASFVEDGMKSCLLWESAVYCSVECREWDWKQGGHADSCKGKGNQKTVAMELDHEIADNASVTSINFDSVKGGLSNSDVSENNNLPKENTNKMPETIETVCKSSSFASVVPSSYEPERREIDQSEGGHPELCKAKFDNITDKNLVDNEASVTSIDFVSISKSDSFAHCIADKTDNIKSTPVNEATLQQSKMLISTSDEKHVIGKDGEMVYQSCGIASSFLEDGMERCPRCTDLENPNDVYEKSVDLVIIAKSVVGVHLGADIFDADEFPGTTENEKQSSDVHCAVGLIHSEDANARQDHRFVSELSLKDKLKQEAEPVAALEGDDDDQKLLAATSRPSDIQSSIHVESDPNDPNTLESLTDMALDGVLKNDREKSSDVHVKSDDLAIIAKSVVGVHLKADIVDVDEFPRTTESSDVHCAVDLMHIEDANACQDHRFVSDLSLKDKVSQHAEPLDALDGDDGDQKLFSATSLPSDIQSSTHVESDPNTLESLTSMALDGVLKNALSEKHNNSTRDIELNRNLALLNEITTSAFISESGEQDAQKHVHKPVYVDGDEEIIKYSENMFTATNASQISTSGDFETMKHAIASDDDASELAQKLQADLDSMFNDIEFNDIENNESTSSSCNVEESESEDSSDSSAAGDSDSSSEQDDDGSDGDDEEDDEEEDEDEDEGKLSVLSDSEVAARNKAEMLLRSCGIRQRPEKKEMNQDDDDDKSSAHEDDDDESEDSESESSSEEEEARRTKKKDDKPKQKTPKRMNNKKRALSTDAAQRKPFARSVSFSDDEPMVTEIPRYDDEVKVDLFYDKVDMKRFKIDEDCRKQRKLAKKYNATIGSATANMPSIWD